MGFASKATSPTASLADPDTRGTDRTMHIVRGLGELAPGAVVSDSFPVGLGSSPTCTPICAPRVAAADLGGDDCRYGDAVIEGWTDTRCGGRDWDDTDAAIPTGATETGYDEADEDGDGGGDDLDDRGRFEGGCEGCASASGGGRGFALGRFAAPGLRVRDRP